METLDRNPNSQWPPNSGVIVGKIVDAMNLRFGAISDRTARRYFRGERIKGSEQNHILFDLSRVLFDSGIAAMPYALPEDFPLYGHLSGGIVFYTTMWDQILGFLRSKPLSIWRTDVASVACLRLAVIDMAIRVAAMLDLAQLPPPSDEVPLWVQEGGGSLFLKRILDECGDKRPTRDRLSTGYRFRGILWTAGWTGMSHHHGKTLKNSRLTWKNCCQKDAPKSLIAVSCVITR